MRIVGPPGMQQQLALYLCSLETDCLKSEWAQVLHPKTTRCFFSQHQITRVSDKSTIFVHSFVEVVAEDGFSVSSNGQPERAHAVRRAKGQDLLRADGDLPRSNHFGSIFGLQ